MTARPRHGSMGWRQQKVYRFICDYQLEHGHPPSIREICDATGLTSTSSVAWHLAQLQKKGLIIRDARTRGTMAASELVTVRRDDLITVLTGTIPGERLTAAWERLGVAAGLQR